MDRKEVEKAILGCMLIDEVTTDLEPDHFTNGHKYIFEAIRNCEKPDLITVSAELRRMGKLEEVGGVSYLTELANAIPTKDVFRSNEEFLKTYEKN